MTGYESYLSSLPPKPEYIREVVYPYCGNPLYAMLRERGILVETERKMTAKILSAADGASTYQMEDGGIAEVMPNKYSGAEIIVIIPPEQVQAYRRYQSPLPFWAWSTG